MSLSVNSLAINKERLRLVVALAKKAHRLNESGKKKLKSFPLWKRLAFYTKFNDLRAKIKHHEQDRFNYTAVMLHLTRLTRPRKRPKAVREK